MLAPRCLLWSRWTKYLVGPRGGVSRGLWVRGARRRVENAAFALLLVCRVLPVVGAARVVGRAAGRVVLGERRRDIDTTGNLEGVVAALVGASVVMGGYTGLGAAAAELVAAAARRDGVLGGDATANRVLRAVLVGELGRRRWRVARGVGLLRWVVSTVPHVRRAVVGRGVLRNSWGIRRGVRVRPVVAAEDNRLGRWAVARTLGRVTK